jgi:hypothetical protein
MLTVKKLRRKPKHFHNFTGLTPQHFDQLLLAVTPLYEKKPKRSASLIRTVCAKEAPGTSSTWSCPSDYL